MSNKNIIEAKNLIFTYSDVPDALSGKITAAVNDISVDIERGSFTAIIGHNGSGKSTLAKLLSGIFTPNSGSVQVYRKNSDTPLDCSNEEHNFDIRKTVGMVFQNPDNSLLQHVRETTAMKNIVTQFKANSIIANRNPRPTPRDEISDSKSV